MKSLHDYRGEARAAHKHQRRAYAVSMEAYGPAHVTWLIKHCEYLEARRLKDERDKKRRKRWASEEFIRRFQRQSDWVKQRIAMGARPL